MRIIAIAVLLCVSACSGRPEPKIETVPVKVPVPIPCKVDTGPAPVYPDTDEALASAANIFERAKLVMAGRILRAQREIELEAAVRGCAGRGE